MIVLTVTQGHKVDSIIEKAIKYNWSIHETQSMINKFYNLTVDFRTITRRAYRVFNYEFFEGASELSDLEILKVELLKAYKKGITRRKLSQQFHLKYDYSNELLKDAIQEAKSINDKGNK